MKDARRKAREEEERQQEEAGTASGGEGLVVLWGFINQCNYI